MAFRQTLMQAGRPCKIGQDGPLSFGLEVNNELLVRSGLGRFGGRFTHQPPQACVIQLGAPINRLARQTAPSQNQLDGIQQ